MLPESKWAELPEKELDACANWEIWRELFPGLEPAWLDLSPDEKAGWTRKCPVDWFGSPRPAVFDGGCMIIGAAEEIADGRRVTSAEGVQLGIHWDASDKQIIAGFKLWLKKQRLTNPNARHFAKRGSGNKPDSVSVLMYIAMLRAFKAGIPRHEVQKELRSLAKKASCSSRLDLKYYKNGIAYAKRILRRPDPPPVAVALHEVAPIEDPNDPSGKLVSLWIWRKKEE